MTTVHLNRIDDPRLTPYQNLKQTNETRDQRWVIAEGRLVTLRLLQSSLAIHSVLLSERRYPLVEHEIPQDVTKLVLPNELMEEMIGFQFHSGVMGCGIRPAELETPLPQSERTRQVIVACPYTTLPENLGAIICLGAGFQIDGLLAGARSIDPFLRRVVRVSMGSVFQLPLRLPNDLLQEVKRLRDEGFQVVATTLRPGAKSLKTFSPPDRSLILIGNEADGLDDCWYEIADHCLTIPMADGADSFNVANAAAIFLYHFSG